ncbi:MAG TPA: SAM-dependent methyltransferase [Rectinema sp.]|nr:SAM-dependent methyltransferase [Rectinema sp.]
MSETEKSSGTLYLIPAPLWPYSPENWMPCQLMNMIAPNVLALMRKVPYFVVESQKTAERLLSRLLSPEQFSKVHFFILSEHSEAQDLKAPIDALKSGYDCAILSEAGLPCIADPGAALVSLAHEERLRVIPIGGDSSLLLALAASGLNGQRFCFLGYMPIQSEELKKELAREGKAAMHDEAARIFIETPYRNAKTLKACIEALPENIYLCVAYDLGTNQPLIRSMSVASWRKEAFILPEQPAVFCFGLPMNLGKKLLQPARRERRSLR